MVEKAAGVLLMAYGSPAMLEEIEPYYKHVRGGRPPSPELLADLRRRYAAIGGTSPLVQRTQAQLQGMGDALGAEFAVELGFKHTAPFIEDGMAALLAGGAEQVVGLVLAPHHSVLSVGQYHERALACAPPGSLQYIPAPRWNVHAVLVELLAGRVMDALSGFPAGMQVDTLFTAHSLPRRAVDLDDPSYPDQLRETAAAVASAAGIGHWQVAWQSAGRTPEPWIEPDLLEVIRRLPATGVEGVLVCPAGFVSDHLEVLYDVDVEARQVAESVGLRLERTASLNDEPRFSKLLADLVRTALA